VGGNEVARRRVTRGRFITLEGGEGVGKSTQAARLAGELRTRAIDVVVTREPGGTAGAEAIRALLMTGSEDRWSARAEGLLFAAARADHVEKLILPALTSGTWVVCDRFIDSSLAYQGGAGGLDEAAIIALHEVGSGGLLPDRTLLLTLPVDEAVHRAAHRAQGNDDRFGARTTDYHARLDAAFHQMALREPNRFRVIDATGSPDDVTAVLLTAVDDLL
jgi:dTMP kinase